MKFSHRILLSLLLSSVATGAIAGSPAVGQATGSAIRPGHMMIGHLNARALTAGSSHYSMGIAYAQYLWPKVSGVAIVYYVIDADSDPNATPKIDTAISTFNADFANIIQWVPWTAADGPNYVDIDLNAYDFSGECEANEGYEAVPAQPMTGSTSCAVGTILHEMGHVIGLWHEQSRPDRNTYVTVNYGNVIKGSWSNFEQFGDDIQLLTPYDYASVMQYPPYSFSRNGGPVIESIPAGIPLSGSEGVPDTGSADYSAADKEAIERLYGAAPTMVTVTSNPVGLQVVLDGETITTPQQFSWALNSSHTLSVASGVQTLTGDIADSTTSATFYYTYGRWNDSTEQTHTIVVNPGNGSPAFPATSPQVATYSANFIQLVPYTAAVYPDSSGTVAVSPQPQTYTGADGSYFVARQQATLTANPTPDSGWNFYEFNNGPFWLPGGLGANPKTFYVPDTGNPVNTTAEFSNTPIFTVDAQPDAFSSNLYAYVDSDFWYTPKNFSSMYDSTWTLGSNHTLNVDSPEYPYSVNSRYAFSNWSDAGAQSHSIASLPASSTPYVATMTPEFAPATNFNYPPCGGSGTLTPSSPTGDGFYPTGQQLTFGASPDSGWTFAGWTYDLTGTANPAKLTANDESLVFANFNIVNAPLTLTGISPAIVRAGAAGFTLTLTGTGFAPGSYVSVNGIYRTVTYVSPTELKVTVNASDVTTPAGFQVFVENFPSGWDGCAVFGYQTFLVEGPLLSQTITFPAIASQPVLTTVTLSATASSGLTVSFESLTPAICTVSGDSASLLAHGTCTIQAYQAGNGIYAGAVRVNQSFTVTALGQTITFPTIAAQPALTTVTLSATASSGLTVSFASLTPSVCAVTGDSASLLEHGTCTIQASQAGNSVYSGAVKVSRSVMVGYAAQTIAFPAIAAQPALSTVALSATASSGLTVSFESLTPAICTVTGDTASLLIKGTCTIQAYQPGNGVYAGAVRVNQSFIVTALAQTITFPTIVAQPALSTVTLSATASSGLTVGFASLTPAVCTVTGNSASLLEHGTCMIQASQAGNSDYSGAPKVNQSFSVTALEQTITFPAIPAQTVNTTLALSATASSGLAVTFTTNTPTICTVTGDNVTFNATGVCTVYASQTGNNIYSAAKIVGQNIHVAPAT
ncbi:MAG: M12 family metallopeptidase [Terracidiphilus sp.]